MTKPPRTRRSKKQMEAHVELCLRLFAQGWTIRKIIKHLRDVVGLQKTTAMRTATVGNARWRAMADKTPEEISRLCYAHLIEILASKESETSARVSAARELAKIAGLHNHEIKVSTTVQRELTREEKAEAIMREIARIRGQQGTLN